MDHSSHDRDGLRSDASTSSSGLAFSRRLFLERGLLLASMAATVPHFIQQSAFGMLASTPFGGAGVPTERVLVVVQLGGGNDGLNTVVPYGDPLYYDARPTLGLRAPAASATQATAATTALELDRTRGLGLHPNLEGLKELFDEGHATVVQGVGYPNPNRSHFTSMDIWHTARTDGRGAGWLGRYFDNACNGTPIPEGAIALGRQAPLALLGDVQKPVAFESPDLFRWLGEELHPSLAAPYDDITRAGTLEGIEADSQTSFLMRTALDARVGSDRIRAALDRQPLVAYPGGPLAQQLRTIGAMIRAGLPTRVYYATLSGFDTHAGQAGPHAGLMRQLGDSLRAFHRDLQAQGNADRVVTLCFSEFGRRVRQNASAGTDHGTAAPVVLVGTKVRPGVLGDHPSLADLDQGDLKHTVDFRSVYAGILEDWLKAPSAEILGGPFRKAELFRT
jgi:uncharacterized protein (DUF1501 family)